MGRVGKPGWGDFLFFVIVGRVCEKVGRFGVGRFASGAICSASLYVLYSMVQYAISLLQQTK